MCPSPIREEEVVSRVVVFTNVEQVNLLNMGDGNGLTLPAGVKTSSTSIDTPWQDDIVQPDRGVHSDQYESHPRPGNDSTPLIASQGSLDDSRTPTLWQCIGLLVTVVVVTLVALVTKFYVCTL